MGGNQQVSGQNLTTNNSACHRQTFPGTAGEEVTRSRSCIHSDCTVRAHALKNGYLVTIVAEIKWPDLRTLSEKTMAPSARRWISPSSPTISAPNSPMSRCKHSVPFLYTWWPSQCKDLSKCLFTYFILTSLACVRVQSRSLLLYYINLIKYHNPYPK